MSSSLDLIEFSSPVLNVQALLTLETVSAQTVHSKQARKPRSYASPKLCPLTDSLTYLLTGVKCRATSVAKNHNLLVL